MQTPTLRLDRRHAAILYRGARRQSHDLWLAARFLGRADRGAMLAVALLLRLLDDIVAGREAPRDYAEDEPGESRVGEPTPASACACGSGSIESRAAVAHNVVGYLFEEAAPGLIGRPELEVFVIVREALRLPRKPFDRFIDGLVGMAGAKRMATRAVLSRLVEALATPLAEIAAATLGHAPGDSTAAARAAAAVRFIIRARQLLALRQAWQSDDRCLIALEDLASFGLRDRDFGSWLLGGESPISPVNEARCARLIESQRTAAMADLIDGLGLIDSLPGAQARALAAYIGYWGEALLDAPVAGGAPGQSSMPNWRAARFRAWRYAISGRVSPRILARLQAIDSHGGDPGAAEVATVSSRRGRVAGERA